MEEIGATCTVVYIQSSPKKLVYCANVGDSRAVLMQYDNKVFRLSYDHKASDPEEQKKVKE